MITRPAILLSLLLSLCAQGQGASVLDYELRSLDALQSQQLAGYAGKPVVMLFFQPDCSWCLRQVRTLNELSGQCPGQFQALAIGVNGDRRQLKAELRRLRPDFPAFQASPALLEDIGGVPATPFSLLGDDQGSVQGWLRGYIPADKLVASLSLEGCTSPL